MRIAIVGTGVAGLVAAHLLHRQHELTVFEADTRIGGHVHTWDLPADGRRWAVDSGFIVYNERNYPHFTRLLDELGVATQPSSMSFSLRCDRTGLEYNGSTARQLFVQRRNVLRPSFLRMLAQVLRFNRQAPRDVRRGAGGASLGDYLERGRYSRAFREHYLLPMASAIWSMPQSQVLALPTAFLVRFFEQHGMLSIDDRPQWRVIQGGSRRYVDALVRPFRDRIRTATPVRRVARFPDRVEVNGERFDRVVLACHSDQALAMLADATPAEREILGALPYQANHAVVHTDTSVLPRARAAWGAWNSRAGGPPERPAELTYDMNILQSLDAPETFCVTLNPGAPPAPERVLGRALYHHPLYTQAGVAAQARRAEISGAGRTHYCGAYWGNGFHEDGVISARQVAAELGALPSAALQGATESAPGATA